MKIVELETKSGDVIPLGKFTVLVGPNNAGKSQTLKDIHQKMTAGPSSRTTIVTRIEFEKPQNFDDLLSGLRVVPDPQNIDHHLVSGIGSNLKSGDQIRVHLESLKNQFENSEGLDFTFGNISKYRVAYLDAGSRLQVVQTGAAHNPNTQPPQTLLQGLFGSNDEDTEETLRTAFVDTFGSDIRLDYSGMTELSLRVAKQFGDIDPDPRKAFAEFNKHRRLDEQGDGFRSFVGVVLSLLLSQGRVVLLDEPEAFLHPAQARQLGKWVAEHSTNVPGQIVVASHNANFLAGILSSMEEVDIFRINRVGDTTNYKRISPQSTKALANSPLLSSQRVLEAIFHKGVVVCEADADRAVYESVAIRENPNQDLLFVHAHNKQTIPQVVELLREAEIPVCAVADFDLLNSPEDLKKSLVALGAAEDQITRIMERRAKLAKDVGQRDDAEIIKNLTESVSEFRSQLESGEHALSGARGALNRIRKEATDWYELKVSGIGGLEGETSDNAVELLDLAKLSGLFIVPVGELEGWLDLETKRKNRWIVLALREIHAGNIPNTLKAFSLGIREFLE